jgi:hypothetical protein
MRELVIPLFLMTGLLEAQTFGFGVGVKAGYSFTGLLVANNVAGNPVPRLSSSENYLVGPAAELRIPFGFAIKVDGLYRGTRYDVVNVGNLPALIKSQRLRHWGRNRAKEQPPASLR